MTYRAEDVFTHVFFFMSFTQMCSNVSLDHIVRKCYTLLGEGGTCTILMPNFSYPCLFGVGAIDSEQALLQDGRYRLSSTQFGDDGMVLTHYVDECSDDAAFFETWRDYGFKVEHDTSLLDYVLCRGIGHLLIACGDIKSNFQAVAVERLNGYRIVCLKRVGGTHLDPLESVAYSGLCGIPSLMTIYPVRNWDCNREETVVRKDKHTRVPVHDEYGLCPDGSYVVNTVDHARMLAKFARGVYIIPDAPVNSVKAFMENARSSIMKRVSRSFHSQHFQGASLSGGPIEEDLSSEDVEELRRELKDDSY